MGLGVGESGRPEARGAAVWAVVEAPGEELSSGAWGARRGESQRRAHGEETGGGHATSCQKPRDVGKCSVMETKGASLSLLEEAVVRGRGAGAGVGGPGPPVLGGPSARRFQPTAWELADELEAEWVLPGFKRKLEETTSFLSGRKRGGWLLGGAVGMRGAAGGEPLVGLQAPGKSLGGSSGETEGGPLVGVHLVGQGESGG